MAADSETTRTANHEAAALLIDTCVRHGVDHFFLAPGARCTPLTLAVADRTDIQVVQHFDERGCAYACLGYARATKRPGVFICTSGTAAANAFPAVVEASQDHVPLLLLTSDRPAELRETGANQTIDQLKLYSQYARWFFDLPCPDSHLSDLFWRATMRYAIDRAEDGPVQLNCMFREPLAVKDAERSALPPTTSPATLRVETKCRWEVPSGRTLVIAGSCRRDEAMAAARLADRLECPFLADISTGLRGLHHDLQLLRRDQPVPDVVLHVGGRIVSKRWSAFIDHNPPQHYLHLSPHPTRVDPVHRGTQSMRGSIVQLCEGAHVSTPSPRSFLDEWRRLSDMSWSVAEQILAAQDTVTEPGVAHQVAQLIPDDSGLVLGNSMPVRDMEMFGDWPPEQTVHVAANRGASGIDGLVATTAGFARGLQRPTTAVIGDLSALHDLNSLNLLKQNGQPVLLIVINNDGGGIFHFLPVYRESSAFERFFGTPHGMQFEQAARMFGLDYEHPRTLAELSDVYQAGMRRPSTTVIEITTDRWRNGELHDEIASAVREFKQ